jgi:hypothetical protein
MERAIGPPTDRRVGSYEYYLLTVSVVKLLRGFAGGVHFADKTRRFLESLRRAFCSPAVHLAGLVALDCALQPHFLRLIRCYGSGVPAAKVGVDLSEIVREIAC